MADILQHLAQLYKLITDDLAFLIKSHFDNIALGHFHIADALELGGEHGSHLRTQAFTQILQAGADGQTVLRESGLAAAIGQLLKDLAHGDVDGVAHQVGVQAFQESFARQDLRRHSRGVGHAGAAQSFHQSLLHNALLHVQGQLAGALLGSAPADTVRQAGNILDLIGLDPFSLFGNRGGAMMRALLHRAHIFHFMGIVHIGTPFGFIMFSGQRPPEIPICFHYNRKRLSIQVPEKIFREKSFQKETGIGRVAEWKAATRPFRFQMLDGGGAAEQRNFRKGHLQ